MIVLLLSCRQPIVESAVEGLSAYDTLPARYPPKPQTVAFVGEALPVWQLRSTARDKDIALFVELHARSPQFWETLEDKRGEYQFVARALREAQLPVVFAGLAYQASQLESRQGQGCRAGPWMLPIYTQELVTGPCVADTPTGSWSPGDEGPVVDDGFCLIRRCPTDLRYELAASTAVAVRWLSVLYEKNGRDALDTMVEAARGPPEAALAQHLLAACADPTLGEVRYCERFGLPP